MSIKGRENINVGLPNESDGSDPLREAFLKTNNNFSTLFAYASPYSVFNGSDAIAVVTNQIGNTVTIYNTGVTNIIPGNGITIDKSNGNVTINSVSNALGTVTSVGVTSVSTSRITVTGGPITTQGNISIDLTPTGVTGGSYTMPSFNVDSYGRITSISNGPSSVVTGLNAGSGISLSGSSGNVTISATGGGGGGGKLVITTTTDYYVNPIGNDNNNGLANTAGGAFATIQGAIDYLSQNIAHNGDPNVYLNVNVAPGTYGSITIKAIEGLPDMYNLYIIGNKTNTIIADSTSRYAIYVEPYAMADVEGFQLGDINSSYNSYVYIGKYSALYAGDFVFNTNVNTAIYHDVESYSNWRGDIDINVACFQIGYLSRNSLMDFELRNVNININLNWSFSEAFYLEENSCLIAYPTFNLAAGITVTGKRFYGSADSKIITFGSGFNYFPGNVAGTLEAGAMYDGYFGPGTGFQPLTSTLTLNVDPNGFSYTTIQSAIDYISSIDLNFKDVIINVAAGTYNELVQLKILKNPGSITIKGPTVDNVTVPTVTIAGLNNMNGSILGNVETIGTYKFQYINFAKAAYVNNQANVQFDNCCFTPAGDNILVSSNGIASFTGITKINSATIDNILSLDSNARVTFNSPITTLGQSVTMYGYSILAYTNSYVTWSTSAVLTGSGTLIGNRYYLDSSIVDGGTIGSVNYIPGNSPGYAYNTGRCNGLNDDNTYKILASSRNYYVQTTGDDNNDGATPGTAWATLQKAASFLSTYCYLGASNVTVNVGIGVYPYTGTALNLNALPTSLSGQITQYTNIGASKVIFLGSSNNAVELQFPINVTGGNWELNGLYLNLSANGNQGQVALTVSNNANVNISYVTTKSLNVGGSPAINLGVYVLNNSYALINMGFDGPYVTGIQVDNNSRIELIDAAFAANTSFSGQFISLNTLSTAFYDNNAFFGANAITSGSAYSVNTNSVLNQNSQTCPGASAGTTSTGGQVV